VNFPASYPVILERATRRRLAQEGSSIGESGILRQSWHIYCNNLDRNSLNVDKDKDAGYDA
jgi:hypothetical protein